MITGWIQVKAGSPGWHTARGYGAAVLVFETRKLCEDDIKKTTHHTRVDQWIAWPVAVDDDVRQKEGANEV